MESGSIDVPTGAGLDPDVSRIRTARWGRRVLVALLAALLVAGLLGVFDPQEGKVSASGGDYELAVDYPDQTRSGLDSPLDISVTRPGGFRGEVEIALTSDWLDLFDPASIEPEPSSATADGERIIWSFEPPPGETLEVSLALTLRPALRTSEEARLAVLENDAEAVAVEFETRAVP